MNFGEKFIVVLAMILLVAVSVTIVFGGFFFGLAGFFKIYIREFSGASELRNQIMSTKSTEEARRVVKGFF